MTAETSTPEFCPGCAEEIQRCEKKYRQFATLNLLTFDEYAYNAALILLTICQDCARKYLAKLPDAVAVPFAAHLESLLHSKGYMPFVLPFVVNFNDEQAILEKTQAIAPKIEQLRESAKR